VGRVQGTEEAEWHRLLEAAPSDVELAPGITAADFLRFHVRPDDPPGAVFVPDVEYDVVGRDGGDRRPLVLHLYRRADPSERRPAVVFVHGGGWTGGHPFQQVRYAAAFAAAGYVTALVSYRLAGEALWPAALADVHAATRWVRANAATLGADPDRVALAGDSAGGHLALMAALTNRRWDPGDGDGDVRGDPDALVLWYPVVDLTAGADHPELHTLAIGLLGSDHPALLAEASPVEYVSPRCPPTLIQVGDGDDLTTAASISALVDALRAHGTDVSLHVEPDAGHVFDLVPANWPASRDRALAFLADVFA